MTTIEKVSEMVAAALERGEKPLQRDEDEMREHDTVDIIGAVATGMRGKRLRYGDLTAENGLDSGARS